jgi:hypothetical protein
MWYSGRKITESLGNVTVRGEKRWKEQEGSAMANCQSMYSITENIYYSQLSSVAILLQPEPVSHRKIQRKDCVLSPYVLSSCGLPLPPTCLLLTVNEARSYFASTTPTCLYSIYALLPLNICSISWYCKWNLCYEWWKSIRLVKFFRVTVTPVQMWYFSFIKFQKQNDP